MVSGLVWIGMFASALFRRLCYLGRWGRPWTEWDITGHFRFDTYALREGAIVLRVQGHQSPVTRRMRCPGASWRSTWTATLLRLLPAAGGCRWDVGDGVFCFERAGHELTEDRPNWKRR